MPKHNASGMKNLNVLPLSLQFKTKVSDFINQGKTSEYIASYITEVCGYTLSEMLLFLQKQDSRPVLCAGGVMANERIKNIINDSFSKNDYEPPNFASVELSGDNAVGIAYLAYNNLMFNKGEI